jgi:biotin operon repressor
MSHREEILLHLKTKQSITPLEALRKFGCFRLAARIQELREDGYNIQTNMVVKKGARFAKYSISGSRRNGG